jgi:exodeoxyribonuclease V alpha subunit
LEIVSDKIVHILYQNSDNGYIIFKTSNNLVLSGNYLDVDSDLKGAEFFAKGTYKKHKKYGEYFEFSELDIKESELFYFLTRVVKGVGKNLANSIIAKYGEDGVVDILENSPSKLLDIKGIKEKKLKKIVQNWHKFKELKSISDILAPLGATNSMIHKVYNHFKHIMEDDEEFGEKLKNNLYMMTKVKGVGFKSADKIARESGVRLDDANRIKACVEYIIGKYTMEEGNSCITKVKLLELLNEELRDDNYQLEFDKYHSLLSELEKDEEIVHIDDNKVATQYLHYAEKFIIENIKERLSSLKERIYQDDELEKYIAQKQEQMGVTFSDQQREAISRVNDGGGFFILCGFAGSGKSTISKAILDLLVESGKYQREMIICTALSGMASDRIRKTSGYNAMTIQSLLVKNQISKSDNLPYDVVLIDETSMVNSELLFRVLKAIASTTKVILVGDKAQLPPIGAGNPFGDLIDLEVAPSVMLTKIYRQSEEKVITLFANQIREAKVPDNYQSKYDDFFFLNVSIPNFYYLRSLVNRGEMSQEEYREYREANSKSILNTIKKSANKIKPKLESYLDSGDKLKYLLNFQVITPMRGGSLGTDIINETLQETLNPQNDLDKMIELSRAKFHLKDKVVHTKNIDLDVLIEDDFKYIDPKEGQKLEKIESKEKLFFKKRIYNGMIGMILKINFAEEYIYVHYPNEQVVVEYSYEEATDLLQLAYALTIHKTQGSEYENVVIPISFTHYNMLNNKLLYTAITRAKEKVVLIGEEYAFSATCRRQDITVRDTVIKSLLAPAT